MRKNNDTSLHTLLNILSLFGALLLGSVLVHQTGYDPKQWVFMGILSVGTLILGRLKETEAYLPGLAAGCVALNVILAMEALHNHHPSIPTYHYEFPASCLKTPDSSDCWFSECSHDLCGFRTTYPLRGDIEVDYAKAVRWMRWEEVEGRTIKAEKKWHCRELIRMGIQRVSFQSS